MFGVQEVGQPLKALQCYLYTIVGPIAGFLIILLLFIFRKIVLKLRNCKYFVMMPSIGIKKRIEPKKFSRLKQLYSPISVLSEQ